MKWFRLWTDILDDVKLLGLTDYEYRMFTYLLAYASEIDSSSGELQTTFTSLSLRFRQRFNLFSHAIETFQRLGLITVDEHGFPVITNWSKRQFKSDRVTDRVHKFRASQPEMKRFRNRIETAPDTDTDTDTPIVPQKGTGYSDDFLRFWEIYPKRVGKDAAWKSWQKRNGDRPDIETITAAIIGQGKSDQWKKDKGQFIPNPSTWINQGRWADEVEITKPQGSW